MRSRGTLVLSIAICVALMACATTPKSYQPQPTDHSKAQAKHLYYAFVGAMLETDREVLKAYMADQVIYIQKDKQTPDLISGNMAIDRFGEHFGKYPANDFGSMELVPESNLRIFTRQEMLEMGDDCPICVKIVRDYLKDGDILISAGTEKSAAEKIGLTEKMVLVFRKADQQTHLIAVMMN